LPFDQVFSTAEPQDALKIFQGTNALTAEAQKMLSAADYTSTIGVFFHTKSDSQQFFGYPSAALAMEAGLLQNVGGITFRSGFSGNDDLEGGDIVSAWIPSETSLALLKEQKQKRWSEAQLLAEAKRLILLDINSLSEESPGYFGKLYSA